MKCWKALYLDGWDFLQFQLLLSQIVQVYVIIAQAYVIIAQVYVIIVSTHQS